MDWMSQLGGLLQQYSGAQNNPQQAPANVDNDFDQFTQSAPPDAISEALSGSFRSSATPPFPQMLGSMFGQSNGMQRAGILNSLLATLGPTVLANILSRQGGGGFGNLGGMLSGGQVTPEMAQQIPPQVVEQAAREAEQHDPTIVDRVSQMYAQNPTAFKALGAAAMAVALGHLANQKRGGLF